MAAPLFDSYLMVDWSAAATPRTGADSIWWALVEHDAGLTALENPPTRLEARDQMTAVLRRQVQLGRRVLAGFDFPNGYPRGTAEAVGLTGLPWQAMWRHLAVTIKEGLRNANNRFEVAADLNRRMSGGPFPFWGCSRKASRDTLISTKTRDFGDHTVPEYRTVEMTARGAKSCWQLLGTGSVGGQTLTGIPVQQALRTDPNFGDQVIVWPFETGLAPPDPAGSWQVVIAEVYPSLFPLDLRPGAVKDEVQVETVANALAAWDAGGKIHRHFAGPDDLSAEQRGWIETEESWILGAGTMAALHI